MASISLLCFHRKPCPSSHHLQHKLLHLDTPFKISWTDDNPQTTVIRFRNEEETLVERTASVDPGRGELPIAQEQSEPAQSGPRQKVHLNTADIFPVFTEIDTWSK